MARHKHARNPLRWIPVLTLAGIAVIGSVSVNAYSTPRQQALSSTVSAPASTPQDKPPLTMKVPQETAPAVLTYTVRSGENLWGVAVKFCGNGNDWHGLLKASPGLGLNPNAISPGEKVQIDCAS